METIRKCILFVIMLLAFSCEKEITDVPDETRLDQAVVDEGLVMTPSKRNVVPTDRYQYPKLDWRAFETHEEKVRALQVPESRLASMDTPTLVRVLFDYPLLFDAFAFDDVQQGLEYTLSQCNAYHEWLSREDKMEAYLSFRAEWEFNRMDGRLSPIEEGQRSLMGQMIATFFDLPAVVGEYEKYRMSEELQESHGFKLPPPGNYADAYATTPLGTPVAVFLRTETYTQAEIMAIRNFYQTYYPNADILSDPTYSYNCHAFAWWMKAGGNERWMNDPQKYISDGSYVKTNDSQRASNRVVYYDGSSIVHSAVVPDSGSRLISKWGRGCLMQHKTLDCPYPTSDIRYYRLKWSISGEELIGLSLDSNGQMAPATVVYSVSDVPATCTIQWYVSGAASILSGQSSPSVTLSVHGDFIISAAMKNAAGHWTLIEEKPVKASYAPIVSDIEFFRYFPTSPGHYVMRAVANKSDGIFTWSTTGATLQDLTYPDDASFMAEPQIFKEIVFPQPGVYTITIESMLAYQYHEYQKNVYVSSAFEVCDI